MRQLFVVGPRERSARPNGRRGIPAEAKATDVAARRLRANKGVDPPIRIDIDGGALKRD